MALPAAAIGMPPRVTEPIAVAGAMDAVSMVTIPAGSIVLHDEGTRRSWRVDVAPCLMSTTLVTCGLRDAVSGATPPSPSPTSASLPWTDVSWNDAVRFCNRLSARAGRVPCYAGLDDDDGEARGVTRDVHADGYRLPTEAEWEHACRAGSNDVRPGLLDDIAWYRDNAADRLHPVGEKQPNAWGLYDVIGNAWEWCEDLYDPRVYGPYRVFRGGGFADRPHACRASCRRKSHPTFRVEDVSFRLVRSIVP